KSKLSLILKPETEDIQFYQRHPINKAELDFLLELGEECEEPLPLISEIDWDKIITKYGVVIKGGHITELGLTLFAHSLSLLPESIKDLKNLEILSIKGLHGLEKLPENLIYLDKLKYLGYEHNPIPYFRGSDPILLPEIICNLTSLEKLHLYGSWITELPDCLVFLPKLNEINISSCSRLKKFSKIIEEFFEYKEYPRPMRRYLIRKKKPEGLKEISPKILFNNCVSELKDEAKTAKEVINAIENTKFLKNRIIGLNLLKKITYTSVEEFKLLENIMISDKYSLVRIAATDVVLHKYTDFAYETIKYILMNETDKELISFILKSIEASDSSLVRLVKINLQDTLALKEIEEDLGRLLPEITNFEIIKKTYYGREGPHGYIKTGNRVTHLGLSTRYHRSRHKITRLPESLGYLDELKELKLIDCSDLKNLP
ncbi:MAG: hypothetical protein ACFE8N_04715, partial [Promethearchaeota archaeon]